MLQHFYDELRDENEVAIIEKYGNYVKRTNMVLLCKTTLLNFRYSDCVFYFEYSLENLIFKVILFTFQNLRLYFSMLSTHDK